MGLSSRWMVDAKGLRHPYIGMAAEGSEKDREQAHARLKCDARGMALEQRSQIRRNISQKPTDYCTSSHCIENVM